MNSKKAKKLRKFVSKMGLDNTPTSYRRDERTGSLILHGLCPRRAYKLLKKQEEKSI